MKQKTPLNSLLVYVNNYEAKGFNALMVKDMIITKINLLIPKEKEQIENTYSKGKSDQISVESGYSKHISGKDYYKQTFE